MLEEQAQARLATLVNKYAQFRESTPVQKFTQTIGKRTREWSHRVQDYANFTKAQKVDYNKDFAEIKKLLKQLGKSNKTDDVFNIMGAITTTSKFSKSAVPAYISVTKSGLTATDRAVTAAQMAQRAANETKLTASFATKMRIKPVLTNLGKVLGSKDIEKHHILLLKVIEPFLKKRGSPTGFRSKKEITQILQALADKGWFTGDANENIAWINKWAHRIPSEGGFEAAHAYLKNLTDIQGNRQASELIDGKPVYQAFSGTYDPKVKYGFSQGFVKNLSQTTDTKQVINAALMYLDDAGAGDQMIGAALMAIWNNPDVGDDLKATMLAESPQNTRRLFEVLDNVSRPEGTERLLSSQMPGGSALADDVSDINTMFKMQTGGAAALTQTADPLAGLGKVVSGVDGWGSEKLAKFNQARQIESFQNTAKWNAAWAGDGLKLGAKVSSLLPVAGLAADVWDMNERNKIAARADASALDKFQAWTATFAVGAAAVPVYGQAANFVAGVGNLAIDAGRTVFEEDKREDFLNTSRAIGGYTRDSLQRIIGI